jgi:hypothetical protein
MDSIIDLIQSLTIASATFQEALRSLVVAIILSLLIYVHFRRFASSTSSQEDFSLILPFVGLTTFLVILVVKSSLALSLGLVGALSIVRFRTPIKDPEELAYIFLTISTGIGLAAGQVTITVFVVLLILVLLAGLKWIRTKPSFENVYITLDVAGVERPEVALNKIYKVLLEQTIKCNMQRFEVAEDVMHVTVLARVSDVNDLGSLTAGIRSEYQNTNICFIDNTGSPR